MRSLLCAIEHQSWQICHWSLGLFPDDFPSSPRSAAESYAAFIQRDQFGSLMVCENTSMEECAFLQSYLLPYLHHSRLAFCPSRGHALNFIQLIQKCAINPRLFTCFHKVVGPS